MQRLLLNIWIAVIPVPLFALGFLVLSWQRRTQLVPWLIFLMTLCLLLASGYHGSMLPETAILATLFCLLASERSRQIPPVYYVLILLLSSLVVTGYEALIPLCGLGGCSLLYQIYKRERSWDWQAILYLIVGLCMLGFLLYRFRDPTYLQLGQWNRKEHFDSNHIRYFHAFVVSCFLGILGIRFFPERKWFRLGLMALALVVLFLFFVVSSHYQFPFFLPYNLISRYCKVFAIYGLAFVFLIFSEKQLNAKGTALLKWCLFIFVIFWLQDWQNTFGYRSFKKELTKESLPGCNLDPEATFQTYNSLLDQNTFMPQRITVNCALADHIKYEEYCLPVRSAKTGRSSLKCLEALGFEPDRFSFDLLVPNR